VGLEAVGMPLAERVTGVDLVPRLAELSARKGYRIFLLGGREGVAERAAKLLESTYPARALREFTLLKRSSWR